MSAIQTEFLVRSLSPAQGPVATTR
jgi:hypothetical protein